MASAAAALPAITNCLRFIISSIPPPMISAPPAGHGAQ
jgi:hypothetical protein